MGVHRSSSVYSGRSADILSGRHIVRFFQTYCQVLQIQQWYPLFQNFQIIQILNGTWHIAHGTWHMAHGRVSSHSTGPQIQENQLTKHSISRWASSGQRSTKTTMSGTFISIFPSITFINGYKILFCAAQKKLFWTKK